MLNYYPAKDCTDFQQQSKIFPFKRRKLCKLDLNVCRVVNYWLLALMVIGGTISQTLQDEQSFCWWLLGQMLGFVILSSSVPAPPGFHQPACISSTPITKNYSILDLNWKAKLVDSLRLEISIEERLWWRGHWGGSSLHAFISAWKLYMQSL